MSRFELVTDPDRLAAVAAQLAAAPALAVDTEFVRRTTFHARPGLLQLSAGDGEFLVDLVALPEPEALRPLFLAPGPLKVMHSCSEDLEVLKRLFGALPGSLVDTQVAAAMLGHPLQTSYQKIVRAVLDIEVPKDETQSDWTARPLSESQLSYAALDVRHLLPLWRQLEDGLRARGRIGWLEEDCARLLADAGREPVPGEYYRQIGSAWRLRPASLDLLAVLAAWREVTARQVDKPRSHVVPDGVLLAVAQRRPDSAAQLRNIADLHPSSLRRYGDDLLRLVREAASRDPVARVAPLPPPLPREAKPVLTALREEATRVAGELGVEVEVLVRRRHLEALVESVRAGTPELPVALSGWRRPVIGDRLLAAAVARGDEIRAWETEAADD
ncbi:MAG: ribonuclease D [Pseudomonadota bacterium]